AINLIQQFKSIQQTNIGTSPLSKVFSGPLFNTPSDYFASYLAIIQALMTKLVEAIHVVAEAQGLYYFLPMPSKTGPEGGFTVRNIIISQNVITNNSNVITDDDFDLAFVQLQALMTSLTSAVAQPNAVPDAAGASSTNGVIGNKITFDTNTSNALGNLNS